MNRQCGCRRHSKVSIKQNKWGLSSLRTAGLRLPAGMPTLWAHRFEWDEYKRKRRVTACVTWLWMGPEGPRNTCPQGCLADKVCAVSTAGDCSWAHASREPAHGGGDRQLGRCLGKRSCREGARRGMDVRYWTCAAAACDPAGSQPGLRFVVSIRCWLEEGILYEAGAGALVVVGALAPRHTGDLAA